MLLDELAIQVLRATKTGTRVRACARVPGFFTGTMWENSSGAATFETTSLGNEEE